ncbi:MAG: nucleotidyltransferase family protein [Microcoleaceae cyanobacterium MO_207.B10]|nr:nucleotidyltransferase family protein [Microcoleaceae cyanobacterium MO_207.B10]
MDKSIGIIILAAGASTRLGQPKQLLIYQEHSLIFNTVKVAVNSGCAPIILVLGAYADLIFPEVSNFPVKVVKNCDWQEGMNSSIKVGINTLKATQENLAATILMLCDQPFVSTQIIKKIIDVYYLKGKSIVACKYAGTCGVPALFSAKFFPEMLNLKTAKGAKQIIKNSPEQVTTVDFPKGAIDIDTFADYQQLILT